MIRADDSRRLESRSIPLSNERSTAREKKGYLRGSSASKPAPPTGRSVALHEDYATSTHVSGGRGHKRTDDEESQTSQSKILKQTEIWIGSA